MSRPQAQSASRSGDNHVKSIRMTPHCSEHSAQTLPVERRERRAHGVQIDILFVRCVSFRPAQPPVTSGTTPSKPLRPGHEKLLPRERPVGSGGQETSSRGGGGVGVSLAGVLAAWSIAISLQFLR